MTVRSYLMSTPVDPQAQPVSNTYRWATVTDNTPLEIQLDGDSLPLVTVPDCLADPLTFAVGDRVWTQMYGRKVIVHGAANGGTGPHTLPNEVVTSLLPSAPGGSSSSGAWTAWPAAHGGPLTATIVKRAASSRVVVGVSISGISDGVGVYSFGVDIDGAGVTQVMATGWNVTAAHMGWTDWISIAGLSAASHTFALRMKSNGPTLSYNDGDQFSMTLREVSP